MGVACTQHVRGENKLLLFNQSDQWYSFHHWSTEVNKVKGLKMTNVFVLQTATSVMLYKLGYSRRPPSAASD